MHSSCVLLDPAGARANHERYKLLALIHLLDLLASMLGGWVHAQVWSHLGAVPSLRPGMSEARSI